MRGNNEFSGNTILQIIEDTIVDHQPYSKISVLELSSAGGNVANRDFWNSKGGTLICNGNFVETTIKIDILQKMKISKYQQNNSHYGQFLGSKTLTTSQKQDTKANSTKHTHQFICTIISEL